jgi:hypothetical protein
MHMAKTNWSEVNDTWSMLAFLAIMVMINFAQALWMVLLAGLLSAIALCTNLLVWMRRGPRGSKPRPYTEQSFKLILNILLCLGGLLAVYFKLWFSAD